MAGSRLCRACGERFVLLRLDQRYCSACQVAESEFVVVDRYIRAHPSEPITRVSLATGVAEESILAFARDGRLERVPPGSAPELHHPCPASRRASCPTCRAQLAAQLHAAVNHSIENKRFQGDAATAKVLGMKTRPKRTR